VQVIESALPHGWFLPVTPGTRHVTVGGAIAADVHGKNHHRDGSIGRFVRSLDLVSPHLGPRRLSPETDPELFWATVGGMGLTGVITEVTLQLTPGTPTMIVDTHRCPDWESLLSALADQERTHRYTVAWVDVLSRRNRGLVTGGDHASSRTRTVVPRSPGINRRVPDVMPPGLLTRSSARVLNEAWYRRSPRERHDETHPFWSFFYPLDGLAGWNRLYGPGGLVQYQVVLPRPDDVRVLLSQLRRRSVPVVLAVLKTLGAENSAPLSFPRPGWTLAVDIPRDTPGLAAVLDALDDATLAAGGRVYLAKDSRMRPELVDAMYPRLAEWRHARRRSDPDGVMVSDLQRRLSL
jgi:decaprenylphospho-beta-D-ribofuranose 2-oxidase